MLRVQTTVLRSVIQTVARGTVSGLVLRMQRGTTRAILHRTLFAVTVTGRSSRAGTSLVRRATPIRQRRTIRTG
jgi:hypothetical protein